MNFEKEIIYIEPDSTLEIHSVDLHTHHHRELTSFSIHSFQSLKSESGNLSPKHGGASVFVLERRLVLASA